MFLALVLELTPQLSLCQRDVSRKPFCGQAAAIRRSIDGHPTGKYTHVGACIYITFVGVQTLGSWGIRYQNVAAPSNERRHQILLYDLTSHVRAISLL